MKYQFGQVNTTAVDLQLH